MIAAPTPAPAPNNSPQTICTETFVSDVPAPAGYPADLEWVALQSIYDETCITGGDPSTAVTTRFTRNVNQLIRQVAPPPPSADQIAQTVIARLPIPQPTLNFAPQVDRLAVNLPIWLWIEEPAPLTETETVGGVSVTVTASLNNTSWNMGEPSDPNQPSTLIPPVTCDGSGTELQPGADILNPPCGYTYSWQSLPERTNDTGTWPVEVTANWAITWTANTGAAGIDTVSTTTQTALLIASYQSILVPDGPR